MQIFNWKKIEDFKEGKIVDLVCNWKGNELLLSFKNAENRQKFYFAFNIGGILVEAIATMQHNLIL